MTRFIVVINRPNQIATTHLADCPHLGPDPDASTRSADRLVFDDRLEALIAARNGMPKNFGFCGHCQAKYRELLAELRKD